MLYHGDFNVIYIWGFADIINLSQKTISWQRKHANLIEYSIGGMEF